MGDLHIQISQKYWQEDGDHEEQQEHLYVRYLVRINGVKTEEIYEHIDGRYGDGWYLEKLFELINLPISGVYPLQLLQNYQLVVENINRHHYFKSNI